MSERYACIALNHGKTKSRTYKRAGLNGWRVVFLDHLEPR